MVPRLVGVPSANMDRREGPDGSPGEQRGGGGGRGPVARHGTHTFPESFDHVKNGKMAEDVGRLPGDSEEIKE